MPRLAVPFDRQSRGAGRYETAARGIIVPQGQTFITARLRRPNTGAGETAWPDLGQGSEEKHTENNGRVETLVTGLDTEVARLYLFVSEDAGATWAPWGYVGTQGGDHILRGGALSLETTMGVYLPDEVNPDRRVQAVLRCRAPIDIEVVLDIDERARRVRRTLPGSIALEDTQGASASSASSVATSNITPAGANRWLVAFAHNVGDAGYSSITFGASTLSQIFTSTYESIQRLSAAEETAPSTTPAAVTYTPTNTEDSVFVGALALSDVDQTTPYDNLASLASGNSSSPAVTVTGDDSPDWRVAAATGGYEGSGTLSGSGANQTVRYSDDQIGPFDSWFSLDTKAPGETDDSFDWTPSGTAHWGARGMVINQAPAPDLDQVSFRFYQDDGGMP